MDVLEPFRDRLTKARPVLREYVTELSDCRAATVLPDAPIAVLGEHTRLAIVDLDTGRVTVKKTPGYDASLVSLIGLTGRRFLAVGFNAVKLYEVTTSGARVLRRWNIDSDTSVLSVAATSSGSRFVVAAGDRFYVGDVGSPRLREFDSPGRTSYGTAGCLAAAISPDGATVAVGHLGTADLYTGDPLARSREIQFNDKLVPLLALGLSPDGQRLAVGDDAAKTDMCDLLTGDQVRVSEGGKTVAARWSADSSVCALVILTRLVGVVGPSGELVTQLEPSEPGTYYFLDGGWTGDERTFVVGTEHGKVLAWTFVAGEDQEGV